MSVDLGKEMPKPCCPPSQASCDPERRHYPSVYLEDVEGLPAIPETGTMTVRFKRRMIQATKREDGKQSLTVTIDLVSIEKVTGEKSTRQSSVDAFDAVSKVVFADKNED